MAKLSATPQQPTDAIVRVEITTEMLNATNDDGTPKFNDDQLREWLTKLRGDREVTFAKAAQAKASREEKAAKKANVISDDESLL